jgi:hypothetical protein
MGGAEGAVGAEAEGAVRAEANGAEVAAVADALVIGAGGASSVNLVGADACREGGSVGVHALPSRPSVSRTTDSHQQYLSLPCQSGGLSARRWDRGVRDRSATDPEVLAA